MHILVPTDFSENALNAFNFAQSLAKETGAEITLLNVVHMQGMPSATFGIGKLMEMVESTIRTENYKALDELVANADQSIKLNREVELTYSIQDCLKNYTLKKKVDLVIAGTKGASGLKKVLIGSNAAAMIENLPVPVMVIPKDASYKGHAHLIYLTDLIGEERDFAEVIRVSRLLKSHTDILHIDTSGKANEEEIRTNFDSIAGAHQYKNYTVNVIREKEIISGTEQYTAAHPTDMICVAPEKKSLFSRFLDRSISKELVYQSTLPVLAIKP